MEENIFNKIYFKGTFRDYQKRILSESEKYFSDGKVNIVAAPGSGKTILGLELIRRLNNKTLILSPTTTIKHQWGERFIESFLTSDLNVDDYLSYDLNNVKAINSITYQALYSMMKNIKVDDEEIDLSSLDILKIIKDYNIKTICLDEAHHLKNEWQKALTSFVNAIGKEVVIISLTATPPYDASPEEWKRYQEVSGDIDAEIFVPELVKEKTLCPHQDYVYFNYATAKERSLFEDYQRKALNAMSIINNLQFMKSLKETIDNIYLVNNNLIFSKAKQFYYLELYLKKYFEDYNRHLLRLLSYGNEKKLTLSIVENIYDFLLKNENILSFEQKKELEHILREHGLINRFGINLDLNDSLKKMLVSSVGKLKSIKDIVKSESENLNEKLRLLILTDYIKKEEANKIGTDEEFNNLSLISIFETLRRDGYLNLGCLSGSVVILPSKIKDNLKNKNISCEIKKIENTDYAYYSFQGNNKRKVEIVNDLFTEGQINILIGTAALLGEGYDSPCINSLILASYVGSFVLSNQMRGRAIRVNRLDNNKTANIFHLVTVEPNYIFEDHKIARLQSYLQKDEDYISDDFQTLKRRFRSFIGPNYSTGRLESGIRRLTIIKKPFNEENIENINYEMLSLSRKRDELFNTWNTSLSSFTGKTLLKTSFSKNMKVPAFSFINLSSIMCLYFTAAMINIIYYTYINSYLQNTEFNLASVIVLLITLGLIVVSTRALFKCLLNLNPNKVFKQIAEAMLFAFQDIQKISLDAYVEITEEGDKRIFSIELENASFHEQNIFITALNELFSEIDNPKYLLVRKNFLKLVDYKYTFACPTIFNSANARIQDALLERLNKVLPTYSTLYTRYELGYQALIKAKKYSFVNKNGKLMKTYLDFK